MGKVSRYFRHCRKFLPALRNGKENGMGMPFQNSGGCGKRLAHTYSNTTICEHVAGTDDAASLYVHWPYCERRCTYCNFNKYISSSVDEERMGKCMVTEAQTLLKMSGVKQIDSVFFGGGTPSLASPRTLNSVLETVSQYTHLPNDAEVTMEVNPNIATTAKLWDFRAAGINRLSIGVQALNDEALACLGRDHTSPEALRCIEVVRRLFPNRMSVDMMFGRHFQTVQGWVEELEELLPLLGGHISLYQLTVERGTKLFKQVTERKYQLPDEDSLLHMYTAAVQLLENHGLKRYEVSNFALDGCESEHNKNYWEGKQYIGVGPGAHGRFTPAGNQGRQSRIQTLEPDNWMYEVENRGHATRKIVNLSHLAVLEEFLMTGLRTRDGITHQRWRTVSQNTSHLMDIMGDSGVQGLLNSGFLTIDSQGLRATSDGILLLDSLLPHLVRTLHKHYPDSQTTSPR